MQTIQIGDDDARKRADILACEKLPTISRAYIKRLFEDQQITVNQQEAKPGYRLRFGDTLEIAFDPEALEKIEDIDLPILFQDNDVIVVNKPSGVISHSRGKYWNEPSVASFVRQITDQEGERAGIVHRLDRATSGVMICAKNWNALKHLQKQFSDRTVQKTYRAVVNGVPKNSEAVIDMPIERNPKKPQTFRAGPQGKSATTYYQVLRKTEKYSLLELKPKTGRTHQLRVHLKEIGFPIVGDELYEGEVAERLMLHAYQLTVVLPSGSEQTFTAPEPEIFSNLIDSE